MDIELTNPNITSEFFKNFFNEDTKNTLNRIKESYGYINDEYINDDKYLSQVFREELTENFFDRL